MKTFAVREKRARPAARRAQGPVTRPWTPALHTQRAEIRRILHGPRVQAKLTVGAPDDAYEREADRVADAVMRMPAPAAPEKTPVLGREEDTAIRRKCAKCEEELRRQPVEKRKEQLPIMLKGLPGQRCESAPSAEEEEKETLVMAKAGPGEQRLADYDLENRLSRTRDGGSHLPDQTRSLFESWIGYDFSDVRVHTDSHATEMANALNAEAFTTGTQIYFNAGRYNPESPPGKRLLAHELTHVVQQSARHDYSITGGRRSKSNRDVIQCYKLKGFPKKKASRMEMSIASAITNIANCRGIGWFFEKIDLIDALKSKRYDYVPRLKGCGWTFPGSWYIEIGGDAFETSKCCYLSSTLAHEAAHTQFYTEGMARWLECNCFSCC